MLDAFLVFKLLHIVLGATWVGALVYDWLFNLQRFRRAGGASGLMGYVEETGKAIPFWATVALGTLLLGFETARRLFDTANPFAWPDAGVTGRYVFISLWLVILAVVLGLAQVPPSARTLAEAGDEAGSERMLIRIHVLGAIEIVLLFVVVALMVGAGAGGYG